MMKHRAGLFLLSSINYFLAADMLFPDPRADALFPQMCRAISGMMPLASIFHEGWLVNGPASLPVSCS